MDSRQDHLQTLRAELDRFLAGRGAHADFDAAVADFPAELYSAKPHGAPHSAWDLLEHLRIAQWDILDFSRNPQYKAREFPKEYWPDSFAPPKFNSWNLSVKAFQDDLKAMCDLVADEKTDLFAKIPHGDGQTVLREALVLADHNSYHLGQMVLLRRILGDWK
jgi:hypothetical protein